LRVDVSVDGERPPPAVESAAYFVAAEALTNAGKHAEPTRVDVRIVRNQGELVVEVTDDGRARPGGVRGGRTGPTDGSGAGSSNGTGSGQGILGMRERARALGGSLEAGPRPDGGFRVRATLPLGAS
ncbi:MAG TPA: ATP-binding protein, partial [Actinomycetota bacterium]|nr:ATP-binding protein [Actinomycetota bacterium]